MNDMTALLGGGAVIGVVMSCWAYVRGWMLRLVSLAVVRVDLYMNVGEDVAKYVFENFRRSPFGLITYNARKMFVRPVGRYLKVAHEYPSKETMVFWKGWKPLMMKYSPSGGKNNEPDSKISISFIRGTFDADKLVIASVDRTNDVESGVRLAGRLGRYAIHHFAGSSRKNAPYVQGNDPTKADDSDSADGGGVEDEARILKWLRDQIGPEVREGSAVGTMSLNASAEEFVREVQRWLDSEKFYKARNIPWRRGWLFQGKPGTGKTALARSVAQDLDIPVCVFDLATMNNEELKSSWKKALNKAPCIGLIEDFDAVFNGRQNVSGTRGGLTFDCLLNTIGGIDNSDGIFLIVTTNKPELLDEAMGVQEVSGGDNGQISTRPGRLDRVLEMLPLDRDGRLKMATRILSECPQLVEELVEAGDGDTGAQFQERCGQVALKSHWDAIARS